MQANLRVFPLQQVKGSETRQLLGSQEAMNPEKHPDIPGLRAFWFPNNSPDPNGYSFLKYALEDGANGGDCTPRKENKGFDISSRTTRSLGAKKSIVRVIAKTNFRLGQNALTPSLSHPMGEGVRRTGEGSSYPEIYFENRSRFRAFSWHPFWCPQLLGLFDN
jgi:hypothetical protein